MAVLAARSGIAALGTAAGLVLGVLPPVAADEGSPPCGVLTKDRYEVPGLPARDYYTYVPCALPEGPVPLVVYLHGCNQSAPEAAIQTRWGSFADAHGLVVVYPEQFSPGDDDVEGHLFDGNGSSCWNWFRPENWDRGSGEPATIAGITEAVLAEEPVDANRIYLMGSSAGGVMASTLGATYPDLYAAIAINAGCGYPACLDPTGELAARAMGDEARVLPAIVFHGTADEAAIFPMGVDAVAQWLGTNDRIDDGAANGSVSLVPASVEHHGLDDSLISGLGSPGDLCVGDRVASPCIGGLLGFESYPYTIARYVDRDGRSLLDFWILHLATHNYVSGDPSVNFSDPVGPDLTRAAYEFFVAHPKDSE